MSTNCVHVYMCWLQHRVRTVYYVTSCMERHVTQEHNCVNMLKCMTKIWRSPGIVDKTNTLSDGKAQVRTDESRREQLQMAFTILRINFLLHY